VDLGNGVVLDTLLGYSWQKARAATKLGRGEALAYCGNLVLAGFSDWHLPSSADISTLFSGFSDQCCWPCSFADVCEEWYYWSADEANCKPPYFGWYCFWGAQCGDSGHLTCGLESGWYAQGNYVRCVRY
jgi:hypothetical protein